MQERLFSKAERLAPDLYGDVVTQTLERERKAHEAEVAAKVLDLIVWYMREVGREHAAFSTDLQTSVTPLQNVP